LEITCVFPNLTKHLKEQQKTGDNNKKRNCRKKKKATERATIAKATTKTTATPTTPPPRYPILWGDDSSAYSPSSFKASDTFLGQPMTTDQALGFFYPQRWLGKAMVADEDPK
jgi:hypothetical protein